MNRTSNVWWLPLARRVLGWGASGALLWALPVAALVASAAFYAYLQPSPLDSDGLSTSDDVLLLGLLFWLGVILSSIFATMGALAGGFAGFYAPATDFRNPLKSRFFRRANGQTFWFWLTTSLAIVAFNYFVFQVASLGVSLLWGLSFSVLLFPLALWRAVNRALKAATASNCKT